MRAPPTDAPERPASLLEATRITARALGRTVKSDRSASQRGIALLIVLLLVAVVSSMSVQFTYNNRTNVWMSGNLTASTQAYFHARSATKIALLAVNAKKNFPQMQKFLSMMGKAAAKRLEIWQRACDFVQIFATGKAEFFGMTLLDFSDEVAVGADSKREDQAPFTCKVYSEDARVNLNRAATPPANLSTATSASAVSRTLSNNARAMNQKRFQLWTQLGGLLRPMLDSGELDSEEEIVDVVLNVIDWTDADDSKSDFDQSGQIIEGTGGESADYGRHDYDAKNAKMDTVGEVQLVEGMTSDIYCQIRDKLTVFATDKINVNDADLGILKGVLCQAMDNEQLAAQLCLTQGLGGFAPIDEVLLAMDSCRNLKKQVYSTPFMSINKFIEFFTKFGQAMGAQGLQIPLNRSKIREQLGTRTKMVRIEAEGFFGDTKRKMVSVVDTSTGALVHFHYE